MNLNVTNDFTLGGNFSCTPGSFIDPSCLIVGSCPNFSPCDLVAKSLTLKDGDNPVTFFTVGQAGTFTTTILMGDSSVTAPDYRLNSITAYAELTTIDARTQLKLRATLGDVLISAAGSISSLITLSSSGEINHNSISHMTSNVGGVYNVFAASTMRLYSSADWQARGLTVNITSNDISLRKFTSFGTGIIWMETLPMSSLTLGCTVPLVPNVQPSIRFGEDLRLASSRSIVTESSDGFLRIGPYMDLVGGRITSSGCGNLSIEVPITNDIGAVVIDDADGLDLKDTNIFSSTSPTITLFGGFITGDITGNSINVGSIVTNTISADTITANTINGAAGTCCVSDRRMKENIVPVDRAKSMAKLNLLEPVHFSYIEEFLREDTWVKNTTHTGLIAQELKKHFPNAVRVREKKVGDKLVKDFHVVRKDELITDMIAAIQYLHKRVVDLEDKLIKTV